MNKEKFNIKIKLKESDDIEICCSCVRLKFEMIFYRVGTRIFHLKWEIIFPYITGCLIDKPSFYNELQCYAKACDEILMKHSAFHGAVFQQRNAKGKTRI